MNYLIYRWKNKATGKVYIGQTSTSLERRTAVHLCLAKNGSRFKFHQALRKYGVGGFEVDVLFNTDSLDEILAAEKKFIIEHDSYINGYNMTPGGQGSPCSPEKAKKISEAKKGKSLPHMLNNNYQSKWIWLTNSINNIRVRDGDPIPEGFHRGRINIPGKRVNGTNRPKFSNGYKKSTKPRKPMTEEHRAKIQAQMAQNNPVSGTIWVNNGIINKRVSKENIPQGFTKGRHSENTK